MGLAASQARLLSITSRKSDCELESMRLSHQKIAMSRDLTDVSNEYQDSLNHTKLFYDYYGKNDKSTQLSYGILMQPSTLNDYMPKLITDATGRVVLDPQLALAAKAAGIPVEGLGCLPSTEMRNKFVIGLAKAGIISNEVATTITGLQYNQAAGVGNSDMLVNNTVEGNIDTLKKYMKDLTGTVSLDNVKNKDGRVSVYIDGTHQEKAQDITLYDLFSGKEYSMIGTTDKGGRHASGAITAMASYTIEEFVPWLYDQFSQILDTGDTYTKNALAYAQQKTAAFFENDYNNGIGSRKFTDSNIGAVNGSDSSYMGTVTSDREGARVKNKGAGGMNLNNVAEMFLTYFAQFMNGVAAADNYSVSKGAKSNSNLVTNDPDYLYIFKAGATLNGGDTQIANFYDALFNQICQKGWSENARINDNEYLQNMLQNGTMYICNVNDDGYYYQGNYATDSYIKEVSDETYIAQAEAKYNTEKAKINQKEQTIDMKMKNLDTEISSLTTEYDTVKNVISKNIEKGFKRYNA